MTRVDPKSESNKSKAAGNIDQLLSFNLCRVFKKTSPNSMLTLYLPTRDLVTCNGKVNPLQGVLHVDKDFAKGQRIFGQLTLTFRWVQLWLKSSLRPSVVFDRGGRDRKSRLIYRQILVPGVLATGERTRRWWDCGSATRLSCVWRKFIRKLATITNRII